MPFTLGDRIERYTGGLTLPEHTGSFLALSVNELYANIPASKAHEFVDPAGITTPVSMPEGKIYSLKAASGYPLREVDGHDVAKYTDSNSIHYAGVRDPVFWNSDGTLRTAPSPLELSLLSVSFKDTIDPTSTTISEFPDELLECAAIGTAIKILSTDLVTSTLITRPSQPSAYSIPAFDVDPPTIEGIAALPKLSTGWESTNLDVDWLNTFFTTVNTAEDFEKALTELKGRETQLTRWAKEQENTLLSVKTEIEVYVNTLSAWIKDNETILASKRNEIDIYMAQVNSYSKIIETAVMNYKSQMDGFVGNMQAYLGELTNKLQLYAGMAKDLQAQYKAIFEAYIA